MKRFAACAVLAVGLVVVPATVAGAHPLGNFTVNQYAGLRVQPARVLVDYVVDMAEIPTFQVRDRVDRLGHAVWASAECRRLASGVRVTVDSHALAVRAPSGVMRYAPGAGGLQTLRLNCSFAAPRTRTGESARLQFKDANYGGHVGWHEVTAVGDGTTLVGSDVPRHSLSARLTAYPQDLLQSPPDTRTARVTVRPGGAHAQAPGAGPGIRTTGLPLGGDRATSAFTGLVSRHRLSVPFALLALGVALVLGAFHALAPGHGKTVMAAFLVGQRGSLRQAVLIGVTVTVTHTAGVLALGVVLTATKVVAPERLYPWLAIGSGLLFATIGASLLAGAVRRRRAHHHHAHDHHHGHVDHHHDHHRDHEHAPIGWRRLMTLGLAGGMVPTPSALIVLLAAIALGRAWFGVVLVIAYGIGMAATLTGAGLLLVRTRGAIERRAQRWRGTAGARLGQLVPVATASIIVIVGVALAARGAARV